MAGAMHWRHCMKNLILGALLLLAGCVTVQVSPERWGRLDQTIQQAEQLGAAQVPMAALHLKMAREQDLTARQLAANGDYRSDLILARAQADATLAVALAHEASIRKSMEQTDAQLRELQGQGQGQPATPTQTQPGGSR
jgi:hypothetical protein